MPIEPICTSLAGAPTTLDERIERGLHDLAEHRDQLVQLVVERLAARARTVLPGATSMTVRLSYKSAMSATYTAIPLEVRDDEGRSVDVSWSPTGGIASDLGRIVAVNPDYLPSMESTPDDDVMVLPLPRAEEMSR